MKVRRGTKTKDITHGKQSPGEPSPWKVLEAI